MEQFVQIPPSKICFSHDTIQPFFRHGAGREKPILETLEEILNGYIQVSSLPKIRVVRSGDKFFALSGNRRLYIYKALEDVGFLSSIEAIRCPLEKVRKELDKKLTTKCAGTEVDVRTREIVDFSSKKARILKDYTTRQAQNDVFYSDSDDESESEDDVESDEHEEAAPPNDQHLWCQRTIDRDDSAIGVLRSNLRAAQADCSRYCNIIERCERKIADCKRAATFSGQALGETGKLGWRAKKKYNVKQMYKTRRREAKQRFVNHFALAGIQRMGKSKNQGQNTRPHKQQPARRQGGPTKRERTMANLASKTQQTVNECSQRGQELREDLLVSREKEKMLFRKLQKARQDLKECREKILRYQQEISNKEADLQDGEVICCLRYLFVKD